jgi:hypothetical protein
LDGDEEETLSAARSVLFAPPGRWLVLVAPTVPASGSIAPFLETFIGHSRAQDDVFDAAFLSGIFVCANNSRPPADIGTADSELTELMSTWKIKWVRFLSAVQTQPGLYVLDDQTISPAWRAYDDRAGAFSLALRPDADDVGRYAQYLPTCTSVET